MWQPIETAPKDQFLLLCGPSGYTTIPMVVTTGRMCSDYHAGRWIDHANDDLTDWGFVPTHWMPMLTAPNVQPAPSVSEGWQLVPVEPTKEMIQKACSDHGYPCGDSDVYARGYRSMLNAAPEAKL